MFNQLKTLIQETKPLIFMQIEDDYLDACGDETPARFVSLQWVWHDDNGLYAQIGISGAIDDVAGAMRPEDFNLDTLEYDFTDADARFSPDTLTDKESWELREAMVSIACGYSPLFNPVHLEY